MSEEVTNQGKSSAVSAYEWISSLIAALVAVTLVFTFLFRIVGVDGESMMNTLHNGDRLVLNSHYGTLAHGDIVVIRRENDKPLIKRVVALEGDVLDIDEESGLVSLNGEVLHEDFVRGGVTPLFDFEGPYTVPEGYVFAMGDNRSESKDSRMLGAFPLNSVVGVAMFRLWPLDQIGVLSREYEE